jgi:multicomponent Na+:H+ antiporter subunit D
MAALVPLAVALPMLVAAGLMALGPVLGGRAADLVALLTALAVGALALLLLVHVIEAPVVVWFGGWLPRQGRALGIDFVVDPLAAGTAALAACLFAATFLFGWG